MNRKKRKTSMLTMLFFAIGLVMYLTGMSNIRDVIPFPRTTGNAEF